MIEPFVAEVLTAVAVASGLGGLALIRPEAWAARALRSPIPTPMLWAGVPALIALPVPAPRLATVPLAIFLGLRLHRLVRSRREARRLRSMDAEVPQLLDLLAAGSAAGLSAVTALRRSVHVLRGPLGRELRSGLEAVELGSRWRDELAAVSDRVDLPDLRRAIAVLVRTEALGASLTDATRELAADVRDARRAAAQERARAAPVKMLFPLVFLVLPAFLLLTVVPVLLTTVRSIR